MSLHRVRDLTGMRFGRLTVIRLSEERIGNRVTWLCRCDCGRERRATGNVLTRRHTKSCGCLHRDRAVENGKANIRHGMRKSPEYRTWRGVKDRCENPHSKDAVKYSERGIRLCERWSQSFEAFYADMGPRPSPQHSIDRIDNDGNYEPGNCRWATSKTQRNNTRNTRYVEWRGEKRPLAEWSEIVGLPYGAIKSRLAAGWTVEDAMTVPSGVRGRFMITAFGKTQTLSEWSRETGIHTATIYHRVVYAKKPPEEALRKA